MSFSRSLVKWLCLLVICIASSAAQAQISVLTQHNDNARTGANLQETVLNPSNVNVNTFGKLFSRDVDGQQFAQPLYVPNLTIAGATHNVVFCATENNSVYAFDADNAAQSAPLWKVNFGTPVPCVDIVLTGKFPTYTSIYPSIGITGTPAIDLAAHTLYAVSMTKESDGNGGFKRVHRLHAIDITTGVEKSGSPATIVGSVPGTGEGSVNGTLTFNSEQHLQRPSLLLANGMIYIAFASFADSRPFHGWLMAYNASTLQQEAIWCDTPNGDQGGFWQSGQGPSVDAAGNIYLTSGNGAFSPGAEYGDAVLKLSPTLNVLSWFTPYNQDFMQRYDQDLGSCGPLLIPGTNYVLQGSKQGVGYLLDRNNLGGFHAGSDSQIVQTFKMTQGHLHGGPVYWNNSVGPLVYMWSEEDHCKAYSLTSGGLLNTTPVSQSAVAVTPNTMPGGFLSISANGNAVNSGVLWASTNLNQDSSGQVVAGIVHAFNASDLSQELWNTQQLVGRDDIGNFAKWVPPVVANGKLYMASFSNKLVVYGLLPHQALPGAPTNLAATGGTARVDLTWTAAAGATTYTIRRALQSGGPYSILARNVTGTSFSDTNANNGTTYYYVVSGVNTAGAGQTQEGPTSNEANATPSAATRRIISIDFVGGGPSGTPSTMSASESAGVVPAPGWNNASNATGSIASLNDAGGTATGAGATWNAAGTWSTPITEAAGNYRLMKGYLNTTSTSTTQIQISNLPADFTTSGYDVYVLFDGNNSTATRADNFTIGSTTISGADVAGADFSGTLTKAANGSAGNYVQFTNLTGASFTLSATPGGSLDSTPRAPVNGIQIVSRLVVNNPPNVAITAPGQDAALMALSSVNGTAKDNSGSGLDHVSLTLKRDSDNQYWSGSAWGGTSTPLATVLTGNNWSKTTGLPAGADLAEGAYTLTATAYDAANHNASAVTHIMIDTTGPTVAIETPAEGATLSGLLRVDGTASDGLDGRPLDHLDLVIRRKSDNKRWAYTQWVDYETGVEATFEGDDWSVTSTLPTGDDLLAGDYELKAVAFDQAGNVGVAQINNITIDKSGPPSIVMTTPRDRARISSLPSVTGKVADTGALDRVDLYIRRNVDNTWWNGSAWSSTQAKLSTTLSGTGTMTWARTTGLPAPSDLTESFYVLQAWAFDATGNHAMVQTVVSSGMVPPTVAISNPASRAVITSLPTISGTASDNAGGSGLDHVDLFIRRQSDLKWWTGTTWGAATPLRANLSGSNWTRSASLPSSADLSEGTYTLYAYAYDKASNRGTTSILVKANMVAPSIAFTAPKTGSVLTTASLGTVSGTASDNAGGIGLGRVDLFLSRKRSDGVAEYWTGKAWSTTRTVLSVTLSGSTWTRSVALPSGANLANGVYSLAAYAYDRMDNVARAASTITVRATAPAAPATTVTLSTGSANAASSTLVLSFSGTLDAATANDATHYDAMVNGVTLNVTKAVYDAATNAVTLSMPVGSLHSGDIVTLSCNGVRAANGQAVSGQVQVTAK